MADRGRKGSGIEIRDGAIRIRFTWGGRRYGETLGLAPTKPNLKHAEQLVAQIKRAVATDTFRYADYFPESQHAAGNSSRSTLGDYTKLYLDSCGGLSANSKAQYKSKTNFWIKQLGADTPMNRLSHSALRSLIGGYPWKSAKHHNNYMIALRGIVGLWVADDRRTRDDPLEGISNRRVPKGSERVTRADAFTEAQEKRLFEDFSEYAVDPQVQNYFDFAFATGVRPEEEIEMKWSDLFLNEARPYFYITRVRSLNEIRPPKNWELRRVELSRRALLSLERQAEHTQTRRDQYVFLNPETMAPWNSTASQRENYWNRSIARAALPDLTPYSTRHTRASRMLMAGCKPAWCARQLGHSMEMFFRIYADWLEADDDGSQLPKVDGCRDSGPS